MRTRVLDATNSSVVLAVYAGLVIPAGFFVALWGDIWRHGDFNGMPFGVDAFVRVAGTAMVLMGCSAAALARIRDSHNRRTSLGWFAIGHAALLGMVLLQREAIWGPGLADGVTRVLVGTTFALAYAWSTADGDPPWWTLHLISILPRHMRRNGGDALRSEYEERIRALAAAEERNRLARDLHDSIKQEMFVIQTAAATAEQRLESGDEGARPAIAQIRASARDAMVEMDAMMDRLRAVPLENGGLVAALERQCEALKFRTGADVTFVFDPLPSSEVLTPGTHEAIFRIGQEALANIARHARASVVRVVLRADARTVELIVSDNGAGYAPEGIQRGMGMTNMRARAEDLDGDLEITSGPGQGTRVVCRVPYVAVDATEFRTKASWAACAIVVVLLVGRLSTTLTVWPFVLLPTFECARYLAAWYQASRLSPRLA